MDYRIVTCTNYVQPRTRKTSLSRMTLPSRSASRPSLCRSQGQILSCLLGVNAKCSQKRPLERSGA